MTVIMHRMRTAAEEDDKMSTQPLPVEEGTDLIRGYKRAYIVIKPGQRYDPDPALSFRGTGSGALYGNEERAACYSDGPDPHATPGRPPETGCRCGFWAVSDLSRVQGGYQSWTLDVDLAGDVIAGDDGWRGEWQRILRVRAPSWCESCPGARRRPVTCVGCLDGYFVLPTCGFHPEHVIIPGGLSWLRRKLGGIEVEGVFLTDAPRMPSDVTSLHDSMAVMQDLAVITARYRAAEVAFRPRPRPRRSLSPGQHLRYDITSQLMAEMQDGSRRMVVSVDVLGTEEPVGLGIQLTAVSPGGDDRDDREVWAKDLLL
jgi:hypothetical protein